MKIEDVRIVGDGPLVLATQGEVKALEARWWVTFPVGYREYVTRLGEGVLGGSFVRVYPPWRVERELAEWRRRINKYWFWDEGPHVLPKERALECVLFGDTLNGDELVFHPARPGRLFVLPRDRERVLEAGADLLAAVEWMCTSGELAEPFAERDFKPFDSRMAAAEGDADAGRVADPEGESLDDLIEAGRRWADRRKALKRARAELRPHVVAGRSAKMTLQAIVLPGGGAHSPGYLVEFSIRDDASGLALYTFTRTLDEDSHGSQIAPNHANLAHLGKRLD